MRAAVVEISAATMRFRGLQWDFAVEAVHKKMERALSSPLFDDGSLIFKSPAWAMRLGAVLLWQRKGSR
jgi:hypothetical protein